MTHKKSGVILITALLALTLLITGCEQAYAPVAESVPQATPTIAEGFPTSIPADSMEDITVFAEQTATAFALESAGGSPAADTPTETPAPAAGTTETPVTPAAQDATATPVETTDPNVTVVPTTVASLVPTNTPVVVTNPTSAPAGTVPATYALKEGEFPYCIARRYNVNPDELLAASSLSANQGDIYQPGLVLTLPKTGNAFPGSRAWHSHPVSAYVVPQNTTVYGVACYFGDVTPEQIATTNNLSLSASITVGTTLQIP